MYITYIYNCYIAQAYAHRYMLEPTSVCPSKSLQILIPHGPTLHHTCQYCHCIIMERPVNIYQIEQHIVWVFGNHAVDCIMVMYQLTWNIQRNLPATSRPSFLHLHTQVQGQGDKQTRWRGGRWYGGQGLKREIGPEHGKHGAWPEDIYSSGQEADKREMRNMCGRSVHGELRVEGVICDMQGKCCMYCLYRRAERDCTF